MAITYDKIAYDQVELELKAILATEFPNVYIGNTFSMKGSECIRIDLVSSTSIEQSTFYEQRLYALNLRYYFKSDTSQERINKAVKGKIDRLRKHLLDYQVNGTKGWAALIIEDINYNVKDEENEEDDNLHIAEFNITIQHHNVLQVSAFSNLSILFDGGDEYLDVGNPTSTQITGAITISAWIKTSNTSADQYIIAKDDNTNRNFYLRTLSSTSKVTFVIFSTATVTSTTSVLDGNWHHVAATFTPSSNIKIFVNGALEATTTTSVSSIDNDTVNLEIGRRGNGALYFQGNIDEVSLWDSALDADTIKAIYNSGRPNNLQIGDFTHLARTHLKGYWRMGDGSLDSFPLIADQTNPTITGDLFQKGNPIDDNGDWTAGTGWAADASNNKLVGTATTANINANSTTSFSNGDVLEVTFTVANYSSGSVRFIVGGNTNGTTRSANGRYIEYVRVSSAVNTLVYFDGVTSFTGDIKDIIVKKINGNPALMINNQASDIEEDTP